ncbi:hypothetical protein QUF88_14370 [Bacillus sp. DX1.1]|uniref:hypothetical protein n=1 Tax=unclassified Bacillus (in: firmicutes) TaxID=185979 RepID=UPI002570EB31|nr:MULTISPECIES: hypothetical protein [unclassified Bacillus (in: firmicutes)]MDM5154960.1 hypothetical protein [Bacillus sp. DX1.1]WJE83824.1 hypothetical protein QRE67_11865 [Bacillus sp. DX3.1]
MISNIILLYPRADLKLRHHIAMLSEEEWFRALHEDARFTSLIWNNRRIKKFLLLSSNMELLTKSKSKQQELTQLIHSEYERRR